DPSLRVVDIRPLAAYNGWRLRGEPRGGHIPGAAAFPSSWLSSIDEPEIERRLRSKDATDDREVVLYGYDVDEVLVVHSRFAALGHGPMRTYEGGWSDWSADEMLPVERLARYEQLVHTEWLRQVLADEQPEAAPAGRFLLFHVNFGVPEEYEEDHIPGALYLDTNWLESAVDWNCRSPAELEDAVCALGITHDTTVVRYGRDREGDANEKWPGRRAGQIAATRAAMILHYCGVDDIRVLDGVYDRWVRAGNPVEMGIRLPSPVPSFGAQIPVR